MTTRRVAVTGLGLVSPLGNDLPSVTAALTRLEHGIVRVREWERFGGLEARLGGLAKPYDAAFCTRQQLRAMGPVAEMAVCATRAALVDAGLPSEVLHDGGASLYYGSTDGSTSAAEDYYRKLYTTDSFGGLLSSMYLRFMSHTCAANVASVFGVTGRVVPICSACTSASQSIGEGFVAVRSGREDVAICGGAEEAHVSVAGVFDLMLATSVKYNDAPERTPRPFDAARDGMIVAEGAGTLVLEEWEAARRRGATIYAELVGYGSSCDGSHLTSPSLEGMSLAMRRALADAKIDARDVGYINAHGTATEVGDLTESHATMAVYGDGIPISSTKSYTGHTLGGCGAIESIFILAMMKAGFLAPTRNLEHVDPRCAPLAYLRGEIREARPRYFANHNFAFGGINTSLIFARPS